MLDSFWNPDPTDRNDVSPDLAHITRALWALVNAATWDETYRVLTERQAILCTDRALALLGIMIDDLLANNEVSDAENWQQYIPLLEDASAHGIDIAWEHFFLAQNKAIDVLEALTNTVTNDEKLAMLKQQQAALLGNTIVRVILRGSISKQREQRNYELADYLEKLLQLLEDAQIHGIPIAWNRYKDL